MKDMFAQGGSGSAGIKTNKQAIARACNVKVSEVIYSNDTTSTLDGKKVVYDKATQYVWKLPTGIPSGAVIVSVSGSTLTYNPGIVSVDLIAASLAIKVIEPVLSRLGAETNNPMVGTFEKGATVTTASQSVGFLAAGELYTWAGTLPKTIAKDSTPANSGGIAPGAWVRVDQTTLRSKLASTSGAAMSTTSRGNTVEEELTSLLTANTERVTYKRAAELGKVMADGGQVGSRVIGFAYCGDSTVWGATVGNLATQNPYNAPASFAKGLNLVFGITPNVYNFGISGTTMKQFLEGTDGSGSTYEAKLQSSAWDVYDAVLCNHCINDSQLNNDINEYRANVAKFVDLTRKYNKVPVLVTPNINPPYSIIDATKSKRLDRYVHVMREVAAAKDVDLVDNYYYFQRSLNTFNAVELVGDGAHPTDIGYVMCGMNACIPFIAVSVLKEIGDFAGLTNSTFYDNMTESRQLAYHGGKYGMVLSGNKHASALQGINFPVILDAGTNDTVLSPTGIQWNSGMEVSLTWNGQNAPMNDYYTGPIQMNDLNRNAAVNWNAVLNPSYCRLPAGLIIIGMLMNPAYAGVGNGMGFSGATLLRKTEAAVGGYNVAGQRWLSAPFNNYCRIAGWFDWTNTANTLQIQTPSGSNILSLKHNGTTIIATMDGVDTAIAASVTPSRYNWDITFNNTIITITIGSVVNTITTAIPITEAYIRNEGLAFSIFRGNR